MKILLINPPRIKKNMPTLRDEICFQDVSYIPFPIRLAQVASVLRKQFPSYDIDAVDANAYGYDYDELEKHIGSADVMIFQSAAGIIKEDTRAAALMKKINPKSKTVIIESVVAPIYPERFLSDFNDVDIILQGQPEVVIPDIIGSIDDLLSVKGISYRDSSGKIVNNGPADILTDLDSLPFMAYDLFPMEKYSISILNAPMHEKVIPGIRIRTTRDCPYGCPFCIIGSTKLRGYDKKWKYMSVKRAVDEIEFAINEYGIWGFFFWDETFTLDKKRTLDFCEEILKRQLRFEWRCLTRIDCVDTQLLRMMYRCGCRQIEFGLEAGDTESRKKLHKDFSNEQAVSVIKECKRAGIRANADMIVGMPWESKDTLNKTLKLAKKLNADNLHLTMAFPYPHTAFYDIAGKENLLKIDDIYDLMINQRVRIGAEPFVKTRYLSSADLEIGWKKIRAGVNKYYVIRKTLLEPFSFVEVFLSCKTPEQFFCLLKKAVRRFFKTIFLRG
ncbi:radical SAM protein [bacterium]|nr:radical SAM protein [bacterium]